MNTLEKDLYVSINCFKKRHSTLRIHIKTFFAAEKKEGGIPLFSRREEKDCVNQSQKRETSWRRRYRFVRLKSREYCWWMAITGQTFEQFEQKIHRRPSRRYTKDCRFVVSLPWFIQMADVGHHSEQRRQTMQLAIPKKRTNKVRLPWNKRAAERQTENFKVKEKKKNTNPEKKKGRSYMRKTHLHGPQPRDSQHEHTKINR